MTEALNDTHRAPGTSTGDGTPDVPENNQDSQARPAEAVSQTPESTVAESPQSVSGSDGSEEMVGGRVAEVEVEALHNQLADAQAKAAEYLDGWQRARAEFANFRRRADKEREDTYQNATVDVLTRLLPVIDDFERALNVVPAEQHDDVIKGFGLIYRKLVGLLEAAGVQVIDPKGQPFDPHYHEAVGRDQPTPDIPAGHVTTVMQKGYLHGNRVVRPALVRVAQ